MTRPRILLTGKNGQVGFELMRTLSPLGDVTGIDVEECDLTNETAVNRIISEVSPDLIVNPAAYTAVDRAESDVETANAVNAIAPGIFARAAKKRNILMVHYSTDYVFNGTNTSPYVETDKTNPVSVYGKSKLNGEVTVRESGAAHLIFRLSWVYGTRGANFLLTMQRLAKEREALNVVNDQIGSPTWSRCIAEATAMILAKRGFQPDGVCGTFHMSAGSQTSWFEFAKAIFEWSAFREKFKIQHVHPIPTSEYPTPAVRPGYSVLSNEKLNHEFGIALPDWQTQLRLALAEQIESH